MFAGGSVGRPKCLSSAGYSTSWISVDLPEPDTPVTATRWPSGIAMSSRFRLCARAPTSLSVGPDFAHCAPGAECCIDLTAAGEVVGGQRVRAGDAARRAVEHHFATARAGAGTDVQQAVGMAHDLRVVLDHDQRVAGVLQALHHADHAFHVARVQADRRFVEHEQRVDQRGAERGRQVDALHFAAGQRARLAVQVQIAEADRGEVAEPRADFGQQFFGRRVERRRQAQCVHHGAQFRCRPLHQVMDAVAFDLPQRGIGLEPAATAGGARRVRAVARQQHADVHLVGLGFQPLEEVAHAIPGAGPGLLPVLPFRVALEHPVTVFGTQLGERNVHRYAVPAAIFSRSVWHSR
jgi:hypothetical protein